MLDTLTLTTLADARRFCDDNLITCPDDWAEQPWYDRYQRFEMYKQALAREVQPGSADWPGAIAMLRGVLQMESER